MKTVSPYRSLPAERRVALLTELLKRNRDMRPVWVQRLVARGGGFRPATVISWPADRLAREVVRLSAETPQDELDLLHFLYVELDPAIQAAFLDAAGVKHDNGRMDESLELPYADAEAVRRGAEATRAAHGEEGMRYLRTLARYARDGWPGIEETVSALESA